MHDSGARRNTPNASDEPSQGGTTPSSPWYVTAARWDATKRACDGMRCRGDGRTRQNRAATAQIDVRGSAAVAPSRTDPWCGPDRQQLARATQSCSLPEHRSQGEQNVQWGKLANAAAPGCRWRRSSEGMVGRPATPIRTANDRV